MSDAGRARKRFGDGWEEAMLASGRSELLFLSLSHDGKHQVDSTFEHEAANGPGGSGAVRASWRDLRLYARYPQGMPAGVDRTRMHERPLSVRSKVEKRDPRSITD